MLANFTDSLPRKIRCTDNFLDGTKFRNKSNAIKFRYIEHNQLYKKYIVIDIDKPSSAFLFEEKNLPVPTIITINKENGHSHYLYELRSPVIYTEAGRRRPQQFYEAVDISLTESLGGDRAYVGKFTKNPLHHDWRVVYYPAVYDLEEFQEYLDLIPARKRVNQESGSGRNTTLFDNLRFWAYIEVRTHNSFISFIDSVETQAGIINTHFSSLESGELPMKEVLSTAKSVGTWTWRHRHTIGNKCNRGVMADQFQPGTPLVVKQMLSADRTNEVRKSTVKEKIITSAKLLKSQGTPVTQNSVSIHANLSINSIKRYWKHVEQELNIYAQLLLS